MADNSGFDKKSLLLSKIPVSKSAKKSAFFSVSNFSFVMYSIAFSKLNGSSFASENPS